MITSGDTVWRRLRSLLRNLPISVLVVLAAFAVGIGIYAAAVTLWSLLLVWWPWLLAGVAALVALGAWWLWWWLPKREADRLRLTDAKARADAEDNFRKTSGQIIGGAAVLIGAAFAYLQFTQQQETAREFEAKLTGATLHETNLTGANLSFTNLDFTNLTGANLTGANLTGANLTGANLTYAHLDEADLTGANLSYATLSDAMNLTREQLDQACGEGVKGLDRLDPPLDPPPTIKPCPQPSPK
jgi:hypothetical protein